MNWQSIIRRESDWRVTGKESVDILKVSTLSSLSQEYCWHTSADWRLQSYRPSLWQSKSIIGIFVISSLTSFRQDVDHWARFWHLIRARQQGYYWWKSVCLISWLPADHMPSEKSWNSARWLTEKYSGKYWIDFTVWSSCIRLAWCLNGAIIMF